MAGHMTKVAGEAKTTKQLVKWSMRFHYWVSKSSRYRALYVDRRSEDTTICQISVDLVSG